MLMVIAEVSHDLILSNKCLISMYIMYMHNAIVCWPEMKSR